MIKKFSTNLKNMPDEVIHLCDDSSNILKYKCPALHIAQVQREYHSCWTLYKWYFLEMDNESFSQNVVCLCMCACGCTHILYIHLYLSVSISQTRYGLSEKTSSSTQQITNWLGISHESVMWKLPSSHSYPPIAILLLRNCKLYMNYLAMYALSINVFRKFISFLPIILYTYYQEFWMCMCVCSCVCVRARVIERE